MPVWVTEDDVTRLLTMPAAMEAVEAAMREAGQGAAVNRPRERVRMPGATRHLMGAALPSRGVIGMKCYLTVASGARFHLLLYSLESGELLAIMDADRLGQLRTGAASGVATRHLSRSDADTLTLFGAGWQAESQLEAIHQARPLRRAWVCTRTPGRRDEFCRRMTLRLGIPVEPADDPAAAVAESLLVTTATSAREPVLKGEWLRPGAHINAVGSNALSRREIDIETLRRSSLIVVDSREQARRESGDLLQGVERGMVQWDLLTELSEIVAGREAGRPDPEAITLFESHGLALWDVAAAARVLALMPA